MLNKYYLPPWGNGKKNRTQGWRVKESHWSCQKFFSLFKRPKMNIIKCCCCCCLVAKQCLTLLQPHELQPARLLCPQDYPGKSTGVGCHFLIQGIFSIQGLNLGLLHWQVDSLPLSHLGSPTKPVAAATAAKSLQSCPTLCDPIDGSSPGSPIPGILQARTLEWVAISFSNA